MGNTEGEAMKYNHVIRDEEETAEAIPTILWWRIKTTKNGNIQVLASNGKLEQIMYQTSIDDTHRTVSNVFLGKS